ncbi:hypothetical protein ACFQH1_09245 [Lactiplantibacillus daoliensis]|uniref:DUF4352 domain-containing protein n=1 Tax=Lactiplantibacillus daoliensis TaxID=2559916 RepID=A0ABW1UH56_9LACO|nr:hypothetical protein [Lactiplantibacillus daoliensis]
MKWHKKTNWVLGGVLLVLIVLFVAKQYYTVNQVAKHPIHEKFFLKNQLVKSDSVNFSVTNVKTKTVGNERRVIVTMRLQQFKPSHYGNMKGNRNITHAMWLNVPYGFSNMSTPMQHTDGRQFSKREVASQQEKTAVFNFTTRAGDYKLRNAPARLSILIPDNDKFTSFTKYSMLLS